MSGDPHLPEQGFQLPEQQPLWRQVHDVLERLIIHRAIEPGTHLGEQELAERFNVSRGPVREALRVLHREGLVEVKHNYGAFVHVPTADEVRQVFEVREGLESQSAALAVRRISDEQLLDLEEIIEEGFAAIARSDLESIIDLNTRFHRKMAEASGNTVLQDILVQLEKRIVWYLSAVMEFRAENSWREHRKLVKALKEGNSEKASRIMVQHVGSTYEAYELATSKGTEMRASLQ